MTVAHELPSLPILPPLEMATAPLTTLHIPPSGPDSGKYLTSPSPSYADSFSTAYTSPSQPERSDSSEHLAPIFLAPPQSLRKSISVDSFVHYGRENQVNNVARASRGNTISGLDPSRGLDYGASSVLKPDPDPHIWSGRSRGASVSSIQDDYNSPSFLDSDVERFDPVNVPLDRYRHASLKGQEAQRPFVPGGELPLPSRAQVLSATSSMSSIVIASTSSSAREAHPVLRSVASLQASSMRPPQSSKKDLGRTRSGSLGMYSSNPMKRMTINTHIDLPKKSALVTLVIIGTTTCGKSSVIRKGLASHGLTEPIISHAPDNPAIRYTRRSGRIPSESLADCPLHVVEVDIPASSTEVPPLPKDLPPIDGVMVCYDASNPVSFQPLEGLLKGYRAMQLPIIVLACKADLERRIEPDGALVLLQDHDVGLVEVTVAHDGGKGKMRQSFDWLLKAVFRTRQSRTGDNRNPASPEYLRNPSTPWENSRTATPTANSTIHGVSTVPFGSPNINAPMSSSSPPLNASTTPMRARSTGDLLYENEKSRIQASHPEIDSQTGYNSSDITQQEVNPSSLSPINDAPEETKEGKEKDSRPAQWATLDELLDKLLFLAVSGDDPAFISHFLLTYRRFAAPRSLLLAMQKRMRQLDNPCGDPMFACFAQMRICHLLETWIRDFPDDFAVKGTAGALNALIKSIISKTHLLHYGSEFLPFLEMLPSRSDQDSSWALKADVSADESDDSYSFLEDEEEEDDLRADETHALTTSKSFQPEPSQAISALRERKPSLPLSSLLLSTQGLNGNHGNSADPSPKQQIKDLVKLAQDVMNCDSDEIAQEITRQAVKRFMQIKPRHWLHYTFISSKKGGNDPITAYNAVSNHLADWVISLILCHDRPRGRARQIEKFVDIAHRLRVMNNYSGLRAFVAGINNATFPGDETMEQFKSRSPEQAKNLQSFDVLLQQVRAHRAYRLALRNTKGACIPALEVHMSDLIRANEGNEDFRSSDPSNVHWGKFNMMGRFVDSTTQCQVQCRNSNEYNFPERPAVAELFVKRPVMNLEMQKSRMASPDFDIDDTHLPPPASNQPRDIAVLRKVFFW